MKKRMLSTMMVTAMAVGMLSGCSSSKPAETEAPAAEPAATEAPAAETKAPAAEPADGEIPVNEAAAADPEVVLVMAEINPLDGTICGAMDMKFKEEVERISGGSIKIDLQGGGVLGNEQDCLDQMTIPGPGDIDICRITAYALVQYGSNKAKVVSIPYSFNDRDHFWKFVNSEIGSEVLNDAEESDIGVKGLFYGEEGFRNIFSREPITSVADLKDVKFRVSQDEIITGMVNDFGSHPTLLPMAELYSALQTGVIDVAEQPTANYYSNAFHEVGPNLTLDGHTLGVMEVVMDQGSWDEKLTENQQQVIIDAGKAAQEYCRQISEERENAVLETLKSEGVNIIEITDKAAWAEGCKNTVEKYTADNKELFQKILDLGK